MATLWIFGDSFATDYGSSDPIYNPQWSRSLAYDLKLSIVNRAVGGTSLEWLYYTWHEERKNIKPGDIVIATITSIQRRWLIEQDPQSTIYQALENDRYRNLSSKQSKAFRSFYRYLHHNRYVPAQLENWLYSVDASVRGQGCRALIMPCFEETKMILESLGPFPDIDFANGYLHEISNKENVENLRDKWIINDARANHITWPNHKILSNKIAAWVNSGQNVDLTKGYFENLIDAPRFESHRLMIGTHEIKI